MGTFGICGVELVGPPGPLGPLLPGPPVDPPVGLEVGVPPVGDVVGDLVGELVGDVVGEVGGVVAHFGLVIVSVSRVTAPLRARIRPRMVTSVVTVTLCSARMVPLNVEAVPRVAELPTCQ